MSEKLLGRVKFFNDKKEISLSLKNIDFTTGARIAKAINFKMKDSLGILKNSCQFLFFQLFDQRQSFYGKVS